jgi:HK97 family phage portal protein
MNAFGRLLVRLGATPPPDNEFWYRPVNAPYGSYLAQFASGESALRLNAVSACVSLRSETVASLPCQVFRRDGDNRVVDRNHPLYYLLHDSPNDDMSAFEFWQTVEQDLCIDGNFYARIETDARNNVSALYPLDPSSMDVTRDKQTGLMVYSYRDNGQAMPYLRDEILHIPGRGFNGTTRLKGMSPIEQMRVSIETQANAENYGNNYFRNNATPPAYIAHPGALSDKAKQSLLDYMMDRFGGVRNSGKLGLLEEGAEIKVVPINHTDMQYIELQKFGVSQIARGYRVPPHKIGELDRSTNNNIEHQGIEWVTDTIRPECSRIERRCNMQLLGPRESSRWYIEFNLDALMRGDSAARSAYYSSLRNIGALNANEIRARENLNPYSGGDVYMVQGAMIPVEMAGQQQQQKAVTQ